MNYQLLPGENCTLTIEAACYYSTDTLKVNAGEEYLLTCDKSERWTDWFIPASANGYWNPLAILVGMRVPGVSCFKLCGVYDNRETFITVGTRKDLLTYNTGTISFFANDAKDLKYYKNNKGFIKLNIYRNA